MSRKTRTQPHAQAEPPDAPCNGESEPDRADVVQDPQPTSHRVAELEELNAALAAEAEDLTNKALRAQADFQNLRRRSQEQQADAVMYANQELLLGLLPVIDNLERAVAAAEFSDASASWVSGVQLTLRLLVDLVTRNGVTSIDAVGAEFDPNIHQAVMRVETDAYPENAVAEEMVRGYMIHGRVLRPSMVKVAVRP